jgi:hypothetical protein
MATKHGMRYSPEYRSWASMIVRCTNSNRVGWRDYGGRGIRVCKRWLSFPAFFKDMGRRPEGMSLDRINNDRGYSPSNCRWATSQQQNLNRSKPRNASGRYVGVTSLRGRWQVRFRGEYLGVFKEEDEAALVYATARQRFLNGV